MAIYLRISYGCEGDDINGLWPHSFINKITSDFYSIETFKIFNSGSNPSQYRMTKHHPPLIG